MPDIGPSHVSTVPAPLTRRSRHGRVVQASGRAAEALAAALAAAFLLAYAWIAVHRAAYPFDLEWMEGSLVQHVARVAAGLPLYGHPTLAFVPFLYPPLYYYVSAGVASLTGVGFLPLRLVSIASSLAIFWLLFRLAHRQTGRAYSGVLAAGLFAATYRAGGAWLDLARNDSLLLALILGAWYLVRWRESITGWTCAGVLLALAALTKQTALMMAAPLVLYTAIVDWRRAANLVAAFSVVLGTLTLALDRTTHGWFLFYVVHLPAAIQRHEPDRLPFQTTGLLDALPVGAALALATIVAARPWRDRRDTFWPLVALGGVGAAFTSRLHVGAYDNVWLPAYMSVSLLAAIAGPAIAARVREGTRPVVRLSVAALCVVQLASLRYPVAGQLPSAQDLAMARLLGEQLASCGGEAFVPSHSFVPIPSGVVMHAHAWAIGDVFRGAGPAIASTLRGEIEEAFADARFRIIVVDKVEPWMEPELDDAYRVIGRALPADGLWTRTGYHTRPRWVFAPRHADENVSCRY